MEGKNAVIFASGPVSDYNYIVDSMPKAPYIICADGGVEHCKKCGFTPDVIIGDMDSYEGSVDESKLIKYPAEKDDTDTSLCIKYAIEKGYENIEIFGAVGGRIDHTIANLQLLLFANKNGVNCTLKDSAETVFLLQNETKNLSVKEGTIVSLFAVSVKVEDITLKGLKYPLKKANLYNDFPLGISNVAVENEIEIAVGNGMLLVVISH